jgi:hypothetical protein
MSTAAQIGKIARPSDGKTMIAASDGRGAGAGRAGGRTTGRIGAGPCVGTAAGAPAGVGANVGAGSGLKVDDDGTYGGATGAAGWVGVLAKSCSKAEGGGRGRSLTLTRRLSAREAKAPRSEKCPAHPVVAIAAKP